MILKIGYKGNGGISTWEYFENFEELKVTPFSKALYYIEESTGKIFFTRVPHDGRNMTADESISVDITEIVDCYFNPEIIQKDSIMYLTHVSFLDKEKGIYSRFVVPSETIYIMNNDGKTIDRF